MFVTQYLLLISVINLLTITTVWTQIVIPIQSYPIRIFPRRTYTRFPLITLALGVNVINLQGPTTRRTTTSQGPIIFTTSAGVILFFFLATFFLIRFDVKKFELLQ